VVSVEPISIRTNRRTLKAEAFAVKVGDVVSYEVEGAVAARLLVLAPKPDKTTRYPTSYRGIVTRAGKRAMLLALPSLLEFHRDGGKTVGGSDLETGDRVTFQVMADDGQAWEVMTKAEMMVPEDLTAELGPASAFDLEDER